jgi:hypothetical protein
VFENEVLRIIFVPTGENLIGELAGCYVTKNTVGYIDHLRPCHSSSG